MPDSEVANSRSAGRPGLLARGEAIRREVLGDQFVDRANQNAHELMVIWQQYAMEAAWGGIWGRPGLDLKIRSLCTISALAALGSSRELRTHLRGALRLGISPEELAEIFIQVGGYAGSFRAGSAFELTQVLLAEAGVRTDDAPVGNSPYSTAP
jgi:alkylhydroperoxidase/carboxymuconolactone decarboxylase family protein YurZ